MGEWETTSLAKASSGIEKIGSVKFPHSLGMLYSTFTAFLGFKPNEGEYKVMGLAPYCKFEYSEKLLKHFKSFQTVKKYKFKDINIPKDSYFYFKAE